MTQGWGTTAGEQDLGARVAALEERVAQLEAALAAGGTGAPAAPQDQGLDPWQQPPWPQIVDLVRRGRKIEAIKVHREFFGTGLRESKNAVDQIG